MGSDKGTRVFQQIPKHRGNHTSEPDHSMRPEELEQELGSNGHFLPMLWPLEGTAILKRQNYLLF